LERGGGSDLRGIGSLILANTVGPKIWALAAKNGWRTVGDYLDHRYSRSVRGLIAVLLWAGTLMILAGQLIAISQILEVVAGVPKWQGCISACCGHNMIFQPEVFSLPHGSTSSAHGEFAGFLLAVPVGLRAIGGWSALHRRWNASQKLGIDGVLYYVAILVHRSSFAGIDSKLYGGRDQAAVRKGINWNAAGLLMFAFAPAILGAIAHSQYPDLANRELALPTLMTKLLPGWLGSLTLAAVFSPRSAPATRSF